MLLVMQDLMSRKDEADEFEVDIDEMLQKDVDFFATEQEFEGSALSRF